MSRHLYPFTHPFFQWGSRNFGEENMTKIIENRNEFLSEFGIYKRVKFNYSPRHSSFDHPEVYAGTKAEIIFICSNYHTMGCGPLILGMRNYLKLYHPDAFTFLATFENSGSLRKALKAANELMGHYKKNKGCLMTDTDYGQEFRINYSSTKASND